MANSYSSSVSAVQVGSYFVQQYYKVLQQQPEFVHQFYTETSTMVRIDGDSSETASAIFQIHTLIQSLNFSGIEIKTINSLESWSDGVLVVVSGSVKSKYFSGWRKFVQTFFLAPQEKGYFVMNDIFHFISEEVIHHHPVAMLPENQVDSQPVISSPPPESTVPDDALEVDVGENLNSIHIEGDDPDNYYSSQEQYYQQEDPEHYYQQEDPEQYHHQQEEPVAESVEEETPVEESSPLPQNAVDFVKEPTPAVEESTGEPVKLTYASILRAPKGKSVPSIPTQPSFGKSVPPAPEWHQTSEWDQIPEPVVQQSVSALSFAPNSTAEVTEDSQLHEEGESKSVYVRNLPPSVSTLDILHEFNNFGRIKHDGVFLKNRKDVGVCFAFVEFEDVESVQKAIQASPIQFAGRQVYVEERRANSHSNSNSASRGGRRGGRGRGSYQYDSTRGRYGTTTFASRSNQGNGFRSS